MIDSENPEGKRQFTVEQYIVEIGSKFTRCDLSFDEVSPITDIL